MMSPGLTSPQRELSLLVSALVDDAINETEFARLNALIESDAAARALFVRFMHQHADLAEVASADLSEARAADPFRLDERGLTSTAQHRPLRRLPPAIAALSRQVLRIARRPTSISLTAAVAVVGILICGMALVAIPLYRQTANVPKEVERLAVAKITRVHQPQWLAGDVAGEPDRFLFAGDRIELRGGFAEILFYNGASVILQGPSVFQVISPSSGRLDEGQLTAVAPAKAVGFSIRTPRMNVVDLGTEFGVLVEKDGATKVDVFSGRVEVAWIDAAEMPAQRMTLGAGEAARVAAGGKGIERVEQNPAKFVRTKVLDELIAEHAYERWQDFAASLKDDPNVVALYDFAQREQSPASLPNIAASRQGKFDGRIDGPAWTTGRWEEKRALRFEEADDCVHLDFTGETFEQLTLSAWVNVERLAHPLTAVFYSNAWGRDGAAHWTILADGRVEFALFGNQPSVVQSDAAALQRRAGRWVHLAVVYDARERHVRFYVNGVSRGTRAYAHALPADLQQVQLGNWNQQERHYTGRMDEVIVFRKALNDEEIQGIYGSGTP